MNKKTIAAEWDEYRQRCYGPKDLSAAQLRETRLAFYGGASVMLATIVQLSAELTEAEACERVREIGEELKQFVLMALREKLERAATRNITG